MRIAIGCDNTGLALKEPLVAALEADGHDVLDLGTFSTDPVDYPDYARAVGQAVLRGFVDASLLLCASGTGGVIAANKMRGIRAAMCHDADAARRSREEVDANVLCLAAAGLEAKAAIEIVQAFIGTQFQPGDPQSRQMAKIGQLEAGLLGADKAPLKPAEEKGATKATAPRPAPVKPAAPMREAPAPQAPPPPPAPERPRAVTTPALVLP
ncbi:MAG TPA: RpiB/LacA/LacB family sugar-phosphate isomerase, partial [Candidatus Udaeobacter sp.]|nr:RpiB/LacA/LacB family sugar-phosphate isomerase [Candidatus Udaeobacter sp.]